MTIQTEALLIGALWVILLSVYTFVRALTKEAINRSAPTIKLKGESDKINKPGSLPAKSGTLFVFIVNIITIGLLFLSPFIPTIEKFLTRMTVPLPLWVQAIGYLLILVDYIWGFFALIYNPNYTPLYQKPTHLRLATRGPYGIIRHPRYASEVAMHIFLFLFTGIWLPLLGLLGWSAVYFQSLAEEKFLLEHAGKVYVQYRKRTGMFLPKFLPRK